MPLYSVTILGYKTVECEFDVQVEAPSETTAENLAYKKLVSGNCSQHPNRESSPDDAEVDFDGAINVRLLRP